MKLSCQVLSAPVVARASAAGLVYEMPASRLPLLSRDPTPSFALQRLWTGVLRSGIDRAFLACPRDSLRKSEHLNDASASPRNAELAPSAFELSPGSSSFVGDAAVAMTSDLWQHEVLANP